MFWGYTEVYVLHKIICGPHEENSSPERKKPHSPCYVTEPMIYIPSMSIVSMLMINNMSEK